MTIHFKEKKMTLKRNINLIVERAIQENEIRKVTNMSSKDILDIEKAIEISTRKEIEINLKTGLRMKKKRLKILKIPKKVKKKKLMLILKIIWFAIVGRLKMTIRQTAAAQKLKKTQLNLNLPIN